MSTLISSILKILRLILPGFVMSWYHLSLAFLGALIYRFPSRELTVIGVTGTDGKSTTVEMTRRVLAKRFRVAATSSVWFHVGEEKKINHYKMGMPGRFFLHRFLRRAVNEGCTHVVIEVSSEGILQHRHSFISWDTAVLTNLSPEHIEHHGSFENYRAEKMKLFRATGNTHIINAADDSAPHFLKLPANDVYTYSKEEVPSSVQGAKHFLGESIKERTDGTEFTLDGENILLRLIGGFNVSNALAAIAVGVAHDVSLKDAKEALSGMDRMPGRMDPVMSDPFTVIVDYAVTPKALENFYSATKKLYGPKNMVCVFGSCGGGRDKWRRPVLGRIASSYCDRIVMTNEDPYDEDPTSILKDIKVGVEESGFSPDNLHEILDRREAIRFALSSAGPGDVVVMTGKGSEDAIAMDGKKIPWSEGKAVREELESLGYHVDKRSDI